MTTHCTHGGEAMNVTIGAKCPWCLTTPEARTAPPVATLATATVPEAVAVAPFDLPSGAPDATWKASSTAGSLGAGSIPAAGEFAPGVSATREYAAVPPSRPALQGPPLARTTDPAAAHEAAARATFAGTFDQWLVLAAHVATRDLTGDELAEVCGRPYQSVGPRRPALERAGLIEETGTRRANKGVYRATDEGRREWRSCPEPIRVSVLALLPSTAVVALGGAA